MNSLFTFQSNGNKKQTTADKELKSDTVTLRVTCRICIYVYN